MLIYIFIVLTTGASLYLTACSNKQFQNPFRRSIPAKQTQDIYRKNFERPPAGKLRFSANLTISGQIESGSDFTLIKERITLGELVDKVGELTDKANRLFIKLIRFFALALQQNMAAITAKGNGIARRSDKPQDFSGDTNLALLMLPAPLNISHFLIDKWKS